MEKSSVLKRLLSGSMLRVGLLFINIIISFFMMPFLIHSLGDRLYGFWSFVGTFMGYYGFLDFGLSSAVTRYISRAYGQKNYGEMNTVINTSLFLFSIIGLISVFVSIIIAISCPFFITSQIEMTLFQKVILILGIDVAISFPMRALTGVLTSKIRYDLRVYQEFIILVLRTALVVSYVINGYGIVAIALCSFSVNVLGHLINFYFVGKEFKQIQFKFILVDVKKIRGLFTYSVYTFITQIADLLRFRIDTLVITIFVGLEAVTTYVIASRLLEYFSQLITNAIGLLTPVFSQLEGVDDFNTIRKLFLRATKISVTVTIFVGISIIIYGKDFFIRWIGPDTETSYTLLIILCASSITGLMQNPSIGLLYGISKHKFYAVSNTCEGILNLFLSLILVNYYGIYGVAMGTAIEMFIFKLFVQPVYISRVIKLSLYEYFFQAIILNGLKTITPIILYYYLIYDYLKPDYLVLFVLASLQVFLFIPIFFYGILNKDERIFLKKNFKPT